MEFLNASDDLEKMKKIIEKNHEIYSHMDVDSARMIEIFSKTRLKTEKYEEEEEINVCKAIDDMIQEAVDEKETQMCKAIDDMIKEAVDEAEERKLIEQICKKIKKNKSLDVIADELEEDVKEIKSVYDKVIEYAPSYDVEAIYEKIMG